MFLAMTIFLAGMFFLTALSSSFRRLQKQDVNKLLSRLENLFFYCPFHLYFFPKHEFEGLFFATVCAQNIARFLYATTALLFLIATSLVTFTHNAQGEVTLAHFSWFWGILSILTLVMGSFLIGDFLPRIFGTRAPDTAMCFSAPFASLFLFIAFPITYLFLRLSQALSGNLYFDYLLEPAAQAKQEIIDIVQKAEFSPDIDLHDKKLIQSVLTFRDLIAREVMVPRVDLFSLSADVTIKEAAKLLENEGYSRTPVYRNTVDNIVGV